MSGAPKRCVTLKLATSLDGRIALSDGTSKWITGEKSREQVHRLRADHDVVLTGIGTVLADDPELTARLPGYDGGQPGRVIVDTRLRTPESARILDNGGPVLIMCGGDVPAHSRAALEARGATVETLNRFDGPSLSLKAVIERVRALGGERIMIEAGGKLAASAIRNDLVDRIEWFRAPILLGGDGLPVVSVLGLERMDEAPIFTRVSVGESGEDLHEVYERKAG
ncbi:RibD family protein [Hyphobacterium sp. HN65]|uniref:RibD family protein n=1 Tax=Hyphobacterium lacteum TaxID=3116575 RepID=A0ABU7LN48_9PROT|nr:RibD family protein [Hyphobacterium sp. HN65]MEE2525024.1 RibD family protein [Hyphobacterium sp. HN65]